MNPTDFIDAYIPLAQQLRDVTAPGRPPFPRPMAGATEQQIEETESHLGVKLDSQHRNFLLHANGWTEFSGTFSLFGTDDLLGAALMSKARGRASNHLQQSSGPFSLKEKATTARRGQRRQLGCLVHAD
ncbi:MAG: SMI1/KNR4 family protein [Bordetella sp.]|nr:SMI1/KNR4 family protein [Bordetella sp.]